MTGLENEGFVGFDGQVVEAASLDRTPATDSVASAVAVESHFASRGSAHADRLTEEITLSTMDARPVDLSESIKAFSATTKRQKQYSTALCDRVAHHASELRGAVAGRELGLPVSYAGPIYAASHLSDRQCLDLAGALDEVSAQLSSRAGIDLPWQLRASGGSSGASSTELRSRVGRLGNPGPTGCAPPEPVVQPRPAWLPMRIGFR
ncbi:hypothetical protein [Actinosynnema sp. NPDC023587]|uniref:hypothetical protein n=1 Tax=Actinosynnema sp. NPDC023587 TaxID=3154695 RepID=UPI00340C68C5